MSTIYMSCDTDQVEAARKKMRSGLKAQGVDISNHIAQIGLVQKYVKIQNGKIQLKFDLKTQNQISESVIVDNDVFIPVAIAVGFIKTPLIEGTTTFEGIENQQIIYFNSRTEFSYTKEGSVSQSKALESLYYSTLSFECGKDTIVSEFPTALLKRVPKGKTEGFYVYENGPYRMLTEFPYMNGGSTNVVKFDVPTADTDSASGDTNKEETYAVLQLLGFKITDLAQNTLASKVKCIK